MKFIKMMVVLGLLMVASVSYAGTIALPNLSNDSDVNLAYFNNVTQTVESVVNGGIESVNITDDTIAEADMANDVNPAVREGEHFNAYTFAGMLPADSADLTSDISAGTSYIEGTDGKLYRVVTAATSKTYTITKDTWVYIDKNGAFQYVEVTVGAAQPTTPADSLLLATVTTDAVEITVVTDRRTLSISLGGNDDYVVKGMEIRADNATICSADAGVVYHGTTRIKKVVGTNLTLATAGNWWDGAVDNYATDGFCFIGVDSDGGIKFLGANPPNRVDTAGNTVGKKHYWYDGTKYWRVIGEIEINSSGSDSIRRHIWYGSGNDYKIVKDVPLVMSTTISSGVWTDGSTLAQGDCSTLIPGTSTCGIFSVGLSMLTDTNNGDLWMRPKGSTWITTTRVGSLHLSANFAAGAAGVSGQRICMTDTSQKINYQTTAAVNAMTIYVEGYFGER